MTLSAEYRRQPVGDVVYTVHNYPLQRTVKVMGGPL